jgi:phenylalanyl-tRNA synthetase alpha subunit
MPPPKNVETRASAVEKLVGDQKIERRQILAQRAYGADRNDAFHAEHFHRADIGAVVDFAG